VVWKDYYVVGVQVGEKGSDIAEVQFIWEIKEKLSVTKKAMVCRKKQNWSEGGGARVLGLEGDQYQSLLIP
jgi:hypothetical protein